MALEEQQHLIFGGIQVPPCCRQARHGDPRAIGGGQLRQQHRRSPEQRSEVAVWVAAHAAGTIPRLIVVRPLLGAREEARWAPGSRGGRPERRRAADASVAPEPTRRLDALQFGKIKRADRLQFLCQRGLLEVVGQVVEPPLILILKVEQGVHRILPAPRSGSAVCWSAVVDPRLRCLAALAIAPLSFGVSHGLCAPLRNGPDQPRAGFAGGLAPRLAAAPLPWRAAPTAGRGSPGGGQQSGPAHRATCTRGRSTGRVVAVAARSVEACSALIAAPRPTAAAVPVSGARSCPCDSSCPRSRSSRRGAPAGPW